MCTWPADFQDSTWHDGEKGVAAFQSSTVAGFAFTFTLTVPPYTIDEWECVVHDPVAPYLVMRYSKPSIARARIARMPDRSNSLADSMFRFFAILNSYYCCGGYFYKPESPEVRI